MQKTEMNLIIPFAKQSGITSFTSLWQVKRALNTKKVGHTGTLDSFADGLLLLLSGKLTRLAGAITDFDKEYDALITFGSQTETLDPEGAIVLKKPLPRFSDFTEALNRFRGKIEQKPPSFSAIHVEGQRASDRSRRGEVVDIPARTVEIYALELIDTIVIEGGSVSHAHIRVKCSKGTYIRSLVRDIAHACNSCAFLTALRRTEIGPFLLGEAAGAQYLPHFLTENVLSFGNARQTKHLCEDEIKNAGKTFDYAMAINLGFSTVRLRSSFYDAFLHGQKIQEGWFEDAPRIGVNALIAVFIDEICLGLISKKNHFYGYESVFLMRN